MEYSNKQGEEIDGSALSRQEWDKSGSAKGKEKKLFL